MQGQDALREWVSREGTVVGPEFLRVDGFLNHRIDPEFVERAGEGLAAAFDGAEVTCVLTAEAAGNVIAYEAARRLKAKALYAKKGRAATMARPVIRRVPSPTKGGEVELAVSADYLRPGERVLVVDDFLYRGLTSAALAEMAREAGAELVGFGFVIEKRFGGGREFLSRFGVPIVALVSIASMDPKSGRIVFAE
ncbi:TPA: xanthine phosphoribosyltransferase [Candidatus Acetothermia bacterium]|nr:xanthine phosphoribosyltransferase [Candidatus Acetothermia bacterium]